jgi:hypothetical protein
MAEKEIELIDHDFIFYENCSWDNCNLCGIERKEKCNKIEELKSPVITFSGNSFLHKNA